MSFFDALCHGLSTVSLGGFSTRSESIGFYNSHAIELVAGVFSLLSAFNFTLWYVAIVKRTFKPFRRNAELRFFLLIALVVTLIATWQVWRAGMYGLTDSLVHAFSGKFDADR
jgi:trk system potassium uptake protein TrkH